jgi:hypothetical protein
MEQTTLSRITRTLLGYARKNLPAINTSPDLIQLCEMAEREDNSVELTLFLRDLFNQGSIHGREPETDRHRACDVLCMAIEVSAQGLEGQEEFESALSFRRFASTFHVCKTLGEGAEVDVNTPESQEEIRRIRAEVLTLCPEAEPLARLIEGASAPS